VSLFEYFCAGVPAGVHGAGHVDVAGDSIEGAAGGGDERVASGGDGPAELDELVLRVSGAVICRNWERSWPRAAPPEIPAKLKVVGSVRCLVKVTS
jgi:hypothetical protein